MRTPLIVASAATLAAGLGGCGSEVFSLPVGACLNASSLSGEEISRVATVDCSQEHDVEAFASMRLTGDSWPGAEDILARADEFCLAEFETFVGTKYHDSDLDVSFLHPTEDSWNNAADREVLCLVIAPEPVTGTLKDSAR